MPTVDELLNHFQRQASLPWAKETACDYRVWILHYEKSLERRVQGRIHEFEAIARKLGYGWENLNVSSLIPAWFAAHDLFEGLVGQPDELPGLLPDFEAHIVKIVHNRLRSLGDRDIFAISGGGSLFGLTRVSAIAEKVAPEIRGRLLLLFPGRHENGVYRLLDARDGWSYRATPIPA
ncbi:MAG: hypothetical protein HC834_04285 [Rhodospirillales bacterium]|nr:hypothetical protein [Rhodospirillales bacterium]